MRSTKHPLDDYPSKEEVSRFQAPELAAFLSNNFAFKQHTLDFISTAGVDGEMFLLCSAKAWREMGLEMVQAYKLVCVADALKADNETSTPFTKRTKTVGSLSSTIVNIAPTVQVDPVHSRRLEAIKNLRLDVDALSDPCVFSVLPFPYTGRCRPVDRFSFDADNQYIFQGRKRFRDLLEHFAGLRVTGEATPGLSGYAELFAKGTMGYGKSHLLATLVVWLLNRRYRCVYVPDCKWLTSQAFDYIVDSFQLAFADDPRVYAELKGAESVKDLIALSRRLSMEHVLMVFVVDQTNSLDLDSAGRATKEERETAKTQINTLTAKHLCIMSASGSYQAARTAEFAAESVRKIMYTGGLDQEEMAAWWSAHEERLPALTQAFKDQVEDMTGCNPLLLRAFLRSAMALKEMMEKETDDIEDEDFPDLHGNALLEERLWKRVGTMPEWKDTQQRIVVYAQQKAAEPPTLNNLGFFEVAEFCLLNITLPPGASQHLDHRYFFVDEEGVGQYSCGLARNVMATFIRHRIDANLFVTARWHGMINLVGTNESMLGFFVEQVLLSSIASHGITLDGFNYGPMRQVRFNEIPDPPNDPKGSPILLLPAAYNYRGIDGIIIWVEHSKDPAAAARILHVIAIQITISNSHSDSELDFFSTFNGLVNRIKGGTGYDEVKPIFLWIVENQSTFFRKTQRVEKGFKSTRNKQYITPAYDRKVVSVMDVSPRVGKSLEQARASGARAGSLQRKERRCVEHKIGTTRARYDLRSPCTRRNQGSDVNFGSKCEVRATVV